MIDQDKLIDIERALIASMFHAENVDTIGSILVSNDLLIDLHQKLFDAILLMVDQNKDVDGILVHQFLSVQGYEIDPTAMMIIADALPVSGHAESYAKIIKEHSIKRSIDKLCAEVKNEVETLTSSASDIIALTESKMQELSNRLVNEESLTSSRDINKVLDVVKQRDPSKILGYATGLTDFDETKKGLQNGELIVIGARSGMGKTALALNIASYMANDLNLPTLIFSYEMTSQALQERILSSNSGVGLSLIKKGYGTGGLDDNDINSLDLATEKIEQSRMYIDESRVKTVTHVKAVTRKLHRTKGIKVIFIDYLQLMNGKGQNRNLEIGSITGELKELALELNIPIVLLSQLNRGVDARPDKRPLLSDLRDSGSIEQDADVIMFLYRESYYSKDIHNCGFNRHMTELNLAKNRDGSTGIVNISWQPECVKFSDIKTFDSYENLGIPNGHEIPLP